MKKRTATAIKVALNDLLKINTDRVERYKRAGYDILDSELKSVFYAIADESRKNISDIQMLMLKTFEDDELNHKPINNGKVYRSWVEVKSKFGGTLRNNLLNACEFGEMAAISAYSMAEGNVSDVRVLELITRQHEAMKNSLEVIKSYRQAYDKRDKVSNGF